MKNQRIWPPPNNLGEMDVLFIDEIHRLNRTVEEILYPAMEDFALDIIIGKGPVPDPLDLLQVYPYRCYYRAGMLTSPLRDKFGIINRMELYNQDELKLIVTGLQEYWYSH